MSDIYRTSVSNLPNVFCVCLSLCDLLEEEQAALPHCSHHKLPGTLHLSGSPAGRLHPLYETQVGECLGCEGFSRAEWVELNFCISHTGGLAWEIIMYELLLLLPRCKVSGQRDLRTVKDLVSYLRGEFHCTDPLLLRSLNGVLGYVSFKGELCHFFATN